MAEAKRILAAILAADVAGYSRLMGDDERATVDMLDVCRDVFRKHVGDHQGRVVDTAGCDRHRLRQCRQGGFGAS